MSSNFINHSTFNSEHDWEGLCIHLKNQQSYTSANHNNMKGGPNFYLIDSFYGSLQIC